MKSSNPFSHLIPGNEEQDNNPFLHLVPKKEKPYYPENKSIMDVDTWKRAGSILGEDISKIPGYLGNQALKGIGALPEQALGVVKQIPSLRPAKNLLIGASEVEKGIINTPRNVVNYLAHLGIVPEGYAKRLMANTGIEHEPFGEYLKKNIGEEKKGDKLLQMVPQAALLLHPEANPVAGLAYKGVGKGYNVGKNVVTGAKKYKALEAKLALPSLKKDVAEAESIAEKAKGSFESSTLAEEEAKAANEAVQRAAKENIGISSPETMQYKMGQESGELTELNQNISALKHQMDNLEPVPEFSKTAPQFKEGGKEHLDMAEKASQAAKQAEENIRLSHDMYGQSQQKLAQAEQKIGQHLAVGTPHDVNAAVRVQNHVGEIEKHYADRYKQLMENLEGTQFKMPNIPNYELDMGKILKQLQEGLPGREKKLKVPEKNQISKEMKFLVSKAPTGADISAADFLAKFKDFRSIRHELISGLKEDPSAESRQARIKAYEDSKPIEKTINDTLEKGLGEEYSKEFKDINKGYSTIVFPLRGNKHVRQAQRQGTLPEDMAKAFRGKAQGQEGVGQQLLRDLVKNDPELVKQVLGQRYASKPGELFNPNATLSEYLEMSPETKQLLQERHGINESVSRAKENIETAKSRHAESKRQETEAHEYAKKVENEHKDLKRQHEDLIKEHEALKKEHEGKKEQREKTRDTLQKEMTTHYDKIKKLEESIPALEKNIASLRKSRDALNEAKNKKEMNLKQKTQAESKFKEAEKKLKDAEKELANANFGYKILTGKLYKIGAHIIKKGMRYM